MPSSAVPLPVTLSTTAGDLAVVAGQLARRLRSRSAFPGHQLIALGHLDREGACTTSRLAALERIRPQSMAQTVAELVAAGAVDRRPDPHDGRQILLEITEDGRRLLERERSARRTWLAEQIAEALDDREQAVLDEAVQLLRRLLEG